jgi:hypothetical protein
MFSRFANYIYTILIIIKNPINVKVNFSQKMIFKFFKFLQTETKFTQIIFNEKVSQEKYFYLKFVK